MEKKEIIYFYETKYSKMKSVQFLSANTTDPSRPAGKKIYFF